MSVSLHLMRSLLCTPPPSRAFPDLPIRRGGPSIDINTPSPSGARRAARRNPRGWHGSRADGALPLVPHARRKVAQRRNNVSGVRHRGVWNSHVNTPTKIPTVIFWRSPKPGSLRNVSRLTIRVSSHEPSSRRRACSFSRRSRMWRTTICRAGRDRNQG